MHHHAAYTWASLSDTIYDNTHPHCGGGHHSDGAADHTKQAETLPKSVTPWNDRRAPDPQHIIAKLGANGPGNRTAPKLSDANTYCERKSGSTGESTGHAPARGRWIASIHNPVCRMVRLRRLPRRRSEPWFSQASPYSGSPGRALRGALSFASHILSNPMRLRSWITLHPMRGLRHPIRSDPMQGLMISETFGRERGLFPLLAIMVDKHPVEQRPYLVG